MQTFNSIKAPQEKVMESYRAMLRTHSFRTKSRIKALRPFLLGIDLLFVFSFSLLHSFISFLRALRSGSPIFTGWRLADSEHVERSLANKRHFMGQRTKKQKELIGIVNRFNQFPNSLSKSSLSSPASAHFLLVRIYMNLQPSRLIAVALHSGKKLLCANLCAQLFRTHLQWSVRMCTVRIKF